MRLPHKAHLAVVDGEHFSLLRNDGTPDEPNLVVEDRPTLGPTNFSAGVRHQDDIGQRHGRTDLDELAHAAAVTEWLNARVLENAIERLAVVADPKTLGEMRRHYHKRLSAALVAEETKTLTGEPIDRIARILLQD